MRILVTGSCGLIGGECVEYFGTRGHEVVGVDNNMRAKFFGEGGDTLWNLHRVAHKVPGYVHHESDIRDPDGSGNVGRGTALATYVFQGPPFDAVLHCAAQPSHDFASREPILDFDVNVVGTRNVLEATAKHSPNAVFIFMSTNKVYDDAVNASEFQEQAYRWDRPGWAGFDESTPLGARNVFGHHKREADEMVRRYAKERGLRAVVLRGGCLTGPGHSGVEAHGFLSYLLKCAVTGQPYRVFGHKGKQVRDNIHSLDVCRAMEEIIRNPRPGEAYNIGGGRANSVSILEALARVEEMTGLKIRADYVAEAREADHRCYITDLTKLRSHYPNWSVTKSLDDILADMLQQMYWGRYSDHEDTKAYDLGPDSVVVDVGGYRGAWSQEIVDRYDPNITIYEPMEEFADACALRFNENPKVRVMNVGLSDRDRRVTFAKQGQNTSAFRGGEGQARLEADPTYGEARPAEATLVDAGEELQNFCQDVDLMSLNCEGGEFDIIPRLVSSGQIAKVRNLQVQFHRFAPEADARREAIRESLRSTHEERFCYPWVWESWRRRG